LAVQKINTYIAKQCSHVVKFPYFVMGSHFWANGKGHTSFMLNLTFTKH
jgi:hypothetical protein